MTLTDHSRTLPAGAKGAGGEPGASASAPDERANRLALFVGAIIAVAFAKEIFRGIGNSPVTAKLRGVARPDTAVSIALIVRMVERMGASVLGSRVRGV